MAPLARDGTPHHEYAVLEKLGKLEPGEREAVIPMARRQWESWYRQYLPELQVHAEKVTDQQLLDVWPEMLDVEFDGSITSAAAKRDLE
jgi:hypothetical protein